VTQALIQGLRTSERPFEKKQLFSRIVQGRIFVSFTRLPRFFDPTC
jgi:hypothetical protein